MVVDSGVEVVGGGVVVDCASPQDTISSIFTNNIVINNDENDLAIFVLLIYYNPVLSPNYLSMLIK